MPLEALPASYSGLYASQSRITVAANNIAIVNTDGFKKSRPVQARGVKAEVEQVETAGPSALEQTVQGEQSVERSRCPTTHIPMLDFSLPTSC